MNLLSRTFNDGTVRNQARLQVRFFKNDEDILNSFSLELKISFGIQSIRKLKNCKIAIYNL